MSKYTAKYFFNEVAKFRKIMCSTEFSATQKNNAFIGLSLAYVNTDLSDDDGGKVISIFVSTAQEYKRRIEMSAGLI